MSQSQRSSGMIAHVAKPGTLDDALDRVMLKDDPASPVPMPTEAAPEPANVRSIRRPRPTATSVVGELTAHQKHVRVKKTLNTRIDDWVEAGIKRVLRELEEQGIEGITKEAIVNQSIIRGLGLTPPEGWEPL